MSHNPEFFLVGENIAIGPGTYYFNRDIIIPQKTKLTINAGTNIVLGTKKSIISYSPIMAIGAVGQQITVTGGQKDPWGVIAVVNCGLDRSYFDRIILRGGSDSFINGIYFSGMLDVYHSDVVIKNSFFYDAHADDSVNVKNGDVLLVNNEFIDNDFDSFDGDWITGILEGNKLDNSGNDGIDISGSKVKLVGNHISNSGDKAISVGERSADVMVINNLIQRNNFGLVSKDASVVLAFNNTFANNDVAVSAYQKKPIFGGANINIFSSIFFNNDINWQDDQFSNVLIEYSIIDDYANQTNINIEPLLDEKMKLINGAGLLNTDDYDQIKKRGKLDYSPNTLGIF